MARLTRGEVTPLEMIDAAATRIAAVEPVVNALPTLCLDRARDHAKRLARDGGGAAREEPGYLAGPAGRDQGLTDVAGVRTTYGSRSSATMCLRGPTRWWNASSGAAAS
ncbi:MAG: hypothetical protein WDN49_25445 [Acetobacteraceae bacterium]